jgi:hypothetical protein
MIVIVYYLQLQDYFVVRLTTITVSGISAASAGNDTTKASAIVG